MSRKLIIIAALILSITGVAVFAQDATEEPPTQEPEVVETPEVTATPIAPQVIVITPDPAAQTEQPAVQQSPVVVVTPEAQTAQQPEVVAADVMYIVVERDNLDRIGAYFDVRVACIRETNDLRPGHILQPGDELLISASCPAYDGADVVVNRRENAPGRDGSDGTYVVRPQDTLDQIGQRLNVSVEALKQANDIRFGRSLRAGQVIVIPENAPPYGVLPARETEGRTETASVAGQIHVVQPQETIDGIGALYDKDHYCIIEANQITNTRLVIPGTSLVIPDDCGPYTGFDVIGR
jgi:LysM repeat protein